MTTPATSGRMNVPAPTLERIEPTTDNIAIARRALHNYSAIVFNPADVVEVRRLPSGRSTWHKAAELPALAAGLIQDNANGQNIYVGANPRTGHGKRGDENVAGARCVFGDFDGVDPEEAQIRADSAGLPAATMVISSGHGTHLYWRLKSEVSDLASWSEFQKDLIEAVGSDPVIHNPERIMRLPGFLNLKGEPVPAELLRADAGLSYDFADLRAIVPEHQKAKREERARDEHRQHTQRNGQASVIDAFNEDTSIEAQLERYGYSKGPKGRYIRPGGETESVNVKDGRSCHWSSDDPLNTATNGEAFGVHDAFDIYAHFEHRGDFSKAVKAAAVNLGLSHQKTKEPAVDDQTPAQPKRPAFAGEPIPLIDPDPPALPAGIIGGVIGKYVEAVAVHTETPRELPYTFAFAMLGICCQQKFSVRPEPGYFEPTCIWFVGAMEPGNRKTAVMRAMDRPLIRWEQQQATEIEPQAKAAESLAKTQRARIDKLRQRSAGSKNPLEAADLATEIVKLEAELSTIPRAPRRLAEDVTPEHLATLMSENGEAIGVLSDEGGIFDLMAGRYSNNVPNLDIYLKSYSGSHVRVDRGSRPPIALNHPALTLGISPQPDVLRGLASKPGFRGRGLLDRPLYLLPTSRLGYRKLESCPISSDLKAEYQKAIFDLLNVERKLDDGTGALVPHTLTFAPEAWLLWKAWQREVEAMLRPGGRLADLAGWGSKLPGNTARIAGLLHCAELTFRAIIETVILPETMARAVELSRLLVGHAVSVFAAMGASAPVEAAHRLWKVIEGQRAEMFTARDAWNPLRGMYKRSQDVEEGFEVLVDHNYIAPLDEQDQPRRRGRPSRRFIVNPLITEEWM